jgi:CRP-like cAMP-binding protein
MFEDFEAYITAVTPLSKDELQLMRSLARVKKLRRRQLLLQEGEVCRYKIFVLKGLLRNYRLKDDGTEVILRFAPENSWNFDHESYNNQTPSKNNIDALEDSEVVLWLRDDFEMLLASIPIMKEYSDRIKATSFDAIQERILMNISATSEEKYQAFVTAFPEILRRVPLHMVASYLGVSRETLSRIRHAQVNPTKNNGI